MTDPRISLIPTEPVVFGPWTLARLAEANCAIRQLSAAGCKLVALHLSHQPGTQTEIVVDRNTTPPVGCPDVHVTWRAA